jgi:hypothetical protein
VGFEKFPRWDAKRGGARAHGKSVDNSLHIRKGRGKAVTQFLQKNLELGCALF